MWNEMSYNKYDYSNDLFRINELYRSSDNNIEYIGFEQDIIDCWEN